MPLRRDEDLKRKGFETDGRTILGWLVRSNAMKVETNNYAPKSTP
jgi:hypothetical protein